MAEHLFHGNFLCLFLVQLSAPPYSACCVGTSSGVATLQIAGGLLAVLLPVVPTFRTDVGTKVAVHKEGVAIVAPRTAEIDLVNALVGSQAATVEDISVGLVLGCGGSCDVGVCLAAYLAVLKSCRAGTEDEIGGSLNIAVAEELA